MLETAINNYGVVNVKRTSRLELIIVRYARGIHLDLCISPIITSDVWVIGAFPRWITIVRGQSIVFHTEPCLISFAFSSTLLWL